MNNTSHKYEQDVIRDFIRYLKLNNYQIVMNMNVKSYEKLNNKDEHERTIVKFHLDVVKPSDDRLEQEIRMFVLTNIKDK